MKNLERLEKWVKGIELMIKNNRDMLYLAEGIPGISERISNRHRKIAVKKLASLRDSVISILQFFSKIREDVIEERIKIEKKIRKESQK